MSTRDQRMADYMAKLAELVLQHGWAVQGVFPTEDGDIPFAYTVGLTVAGLPELILSGPFPQEQIQTWLNQAALRHLAAEIQPGDVLDEMANVPFRVIAADPQVAPIQQAYNYLNDPNRRRNKVRLLQIIWPDKDGNYPDEPGWPEGANSQETWPA